ncbi:MAG: carbohydrate ABC transporter permease, partial [Acholeplasmataceae bacterium]|nr:carbohydrate ABC transporter permease [Acholeplasmataceae bacterium]
MRRFNGVEKTIFALILATVCIGIIVPLMFFLANSFSNATEIYEYPKSPLISFKVTVKVEYLEENDEYAVFFKAKDGTYMNAIISGSGLILSNYFEQYFSVYQSPDELLEDFSTTKTDGSTEFTYNKNMFHNVKTFFLITSNAERALKNSMLVVVYTIIISLTLGSMCGYAMARYH